MRRCANCNQDTPNPRFCSRTCSAQLTNRESPRRKRIHFCACGAPKRGSNNRCSACYERNLFGQSTTLSQVRERSLANHQHASWANAQVRSLGRQLHRSILALPCHNCGYSKHVELCHIRAITSFPLTATLREVNDASNVVQLCRNCHWEFDHGHLALGALGGIRTHMIQP